MTNPITTPDSDNLAEGILNWLTANRLYVGVAAATVVVAALTYWFMATSRQNATASATRDLNRAKQSVMVGNAELATADLQRIVDRYGSTAPGGEAALILAQAHFEAERVQDGITVLERAVSKAPEAMRPSIRALLADGRSQSGQHAQAARDYEQAASGATLPVERAGYRAKAARAHAAAGDTAKARDIWTALQADAKLGAVAAEARVRLGEMTIKPAGN
jgi:predicted negative regulator of RcsB-dependent stress response